MFGCLMVVGVNRLNEVLTGQNYTHEQPLLTSPCKIYIVASEAPLYYFLLRQVPHSFNMRFSYSHFSFGTSFAI